MMLNPGNEDNHYRGAYQPMDFAMDFNSPWYQLCNIAKYLSRHERKGGLLDLKKARFFVEKLPCPGSLTQYTPYQKVYILKKAEEIFDGSQTMEGMVLISCLHHAMYSGKEGSVTSVYKDQALDMLEVLAKTVYKGSTK